MRRSSASSALAIVVAVLVLGACGSASNNAAAPVTPAKGGLLREGLVQLVSADPAKAQTVSERQMADQLYDGLTSWSPDGLNAVPDIAQSWQSSSDEKHWTFHINPAAKASNGDEITATDVKRSLEHIARKSSGSVSTDLLSPISGFADFSTNDQVASLLGVVVVDPATVRIDLDSSFGDLPLLLGNPTFGIVHYGATANFTTGPFMVGQQPDANHVTLVKSPGSVANVDTIAVTYFANVDDSYAAFKANTVDWTPVSPEAADMAGKTYGTQLFRPSLRTLYLSFNLGNANLASSQFRAALVQAIDRNAVVQALGEGAKELDGVVPDGVPGQAAGGCGAPCRYDVAGARSLLDAAFPNGGIPTLTITLPTGDPFTDAAANRIVSDLATVGVTAGVTRVSAAQFAGVTVDPNRDIFQTSWSAAYPSGGAFLQPLFQSSSGSNVTGLKDAKTDADIQRAQTTQNDSGRLDAFKSVETDVLNQTPIIPIATFPVDSVEQARVRGIEPLPTGNFDVTRAWVTTPQP